ncbi:PilZ domain-containing protein [Vibrio profundi]|uniref:PilZ domain-containing protein n=1 Tax=Vibrio profundi TaxID=1774960 RepID=UPI003736A5E1
MPSTTNQTQHLIKYLKPGTRVSAALQFGPDDSVSISATYVGIKHESYLLLDLSKLVVESLVLRKLENVDIIIRAITDTELGHIIAFKTSIICQISKPTHILFLRPPTNIATKPVREHERYKIDLECQLVSQSITYEGKLVDFSISGCGIYVTEDPDLNSKSKIEIHSKLNDLLPADIHYQVVRVTKKKGGWVVGIRYEQSIEMCQDLKREVLEQAFLAGSL